MTYSFQDLPGSKFRHPIENEKNRILNVQLIYMGYAACKTAIPRTALVILASDANIKIGVRVRRRGVHLLCTCFMKKNCNAKIVHIQTYLDLLANCWYCYSKMRSAMCYLQKIRCYVICKMTISCYVLCTVAYNGHHIFLFIIIFYFLNYLL